jgi:tetrahydromethanopterin S-methyltransferase subunit B
MHPLIIVILMMILKISPRYCPFPTFPDTSNLWKIPSTYDSELHLQFYSVLVGLFILAMHLLGRATSVEAARVNCTEQSDSLVLCDECH